MKCDMKYAVHSKESLSWVCGFLPVTYRSYVKIVIT